MKLNYQFRNVDLLKTALTHPSLTKNKQIDNYEKLEFLGDNVLNLILAESLYQIFPDFNEGKLSQVHSNLVCSKTLATIATTLGLGNAMFMDKGEEMNGGRLNEKNLENCLEAVVAAVFLDSDFISTRTLFLPYWQPFIEDKNYAFKRDAKSLIQEWSQKNKLGLPKYAIEAEKGSAHSKVYTVNLEISGYSLVSGEGSSIKKAEVEAAEKFIKLNGIQSE